MLKDHVKVAAAQLTPVFYSKGETINKACRVIEEAGHNGAELVVFPETFIPGYAYWRGVTPISKWSDLMVQYQKDSLRIPSPETDMLCEVTKNANIFCAIGVSEISGRPGSATLYNSILFITNKGEIMGKHRKLMPTHSERSVWGLGGPEDVQVYDTPIGRLGGLVCYENHMTLLKGAMSHMGEEIHCALWPGWWVMEKHSGAKRRINPEVDSPHLCEIEYGVREYAFETQTFVISVSPYVPEKDMPEEGKAFNMAAGGSFIVNPSGLPIVEPVFEKETIIYATLDVDVWRASKAYFDAVGHYSRPDIFQLLMNQKPITPL
jgi:amidase/nitrilase